MMTKQLKTHVWVILTYSTVLVLNHSSITCRNILNECRINKLVFNTFFEKFVINLREYTELFKDEDDIKHNKLITCTSEHFFFTKLANIVHKREIYIISF